MLKQWIIGTEKVTEKKLFVWNVIGSALFAVASMILTYLTINMIGADDGGVFAIGLTLAQMFAFIAYYEMRSYQVTDSENKYTFKDYYTVKLINCIIMMVVTIAYILLKQYDGYKSIVVFLVCIYRMLDGYADVFESQFHTDGRLDLAGKSLAFRTIISVVTYFVILGISNDLLIALVGAIVSGLVGIYIFNIDIYREFGKIGISKDVSKIIGVLRDCFPLFVGMFLWTYLLSASRIAVDNVMSSEHQSYYQVLFLPVSVINLFAGFLIRPSLIQLTKLCSENEMQDFWKIIRRISLYLVVFTVICMVGAYVLGIPVLNILTGCDLAEYRVLFVFLIFAGGFNAIAYLFYFILTIFRSQIGIIGGYSIASLFALLTSNYMTEKWGLWGAASNYMCSVVILTIVFSGCLQYYNCLKIKSEL